MEVVHTSVLKNEVIDYLKPAHAGDLLIDATLGEGGHSELFLQRFPDLKVIGIDADKSILVKARQRLENFQDRVSFYNQWFDDFLIHYPVDKKPDRILFDLGISSYHFEASERGFSFSSEEPLDMRLGFENSVSAADIVNRYSKEELADIFYYYGEERFSRKIAAVIVKNRNSEEIKTSKQLADIIRSAIPPAKRERRIHPATRCFQALRIAVNDELERLKRALEAGAELLKTEGRMGVISFHSLEDRIVKNFFREKNKVCTCPEDAPQCSCRGERQFRILTKKPVRGSEEEIRANPRARSAKFRVAEKIAS